MHGEYLENTLSNDLMRNYFKRKVKVIEMLYGKEVNWFELTLRRNFLTADMIEEKLKVRTGRA